MDLNSMNSFVWTLEGQTLGRNMWEDTNSSKDWTNQICIIRNSLQLTNSRTSRVHLTMPTCPPFSCTGADVEARSWSRNFSKSISNENVGWPVISTCLLAMMRQTMGYEKSNDISKRCVPLNR